MRSYKAVWEPRAEMTPEDLKMKGMELFGDWGWQTRLSECLRVDGSTVRRWLSGRTQIPGPAIVAIELLVREKRRDSHQESQSSTHNVGG